jgi:hypothetical protein
MGNNPTVGVLLESHCIAFYRAVASSVMPLRNQEFMAQNISYYEILGYESPSFQGRISADRWWQDSVFAMHCHLHSHEKPVWQTCTKGK